MYWAGRVDDLVGRLAHPPGDDPGDPGQDLDHQVGVRPMSSTDVLPGDRSGRRVVDGPGGGRVRVFVHQRAFPEEVVLPEEGQPLLLPEGAPLEQLDLPLEDHEHPPAGLVLLEEDGAGRVRFGPPLGYEPGPLAFVQVLEQLDALQEFADVVRSSRLRPDIVSGTVA